MASFHSGSVFCVILVVLCMAVPILAKGHTVGDSSGWAIGMDYSTWTSGKTFSVGDSLVFNYGGGHTVDEVSASDYSTCTTGNAITSDSSGATTITLKTAGTHYFICGVPGHCGSGMKLAVTVAAAGSSTTPSSSETPTSGGTTTSPASGTTSIYKPSSNSAPTSSSGINFSTLTALASACVALFVMSYEIMVFNYGGGHTVDEVSASDYSTCTTGNAITSDSSGATTITLKTAGTHYFICGVAGHCGSGMKLAVTVAAAGSSTTPSSSKTPSSGGTTTSPASGATTSPAGGTTSIYKPSSNSAPISSSGINFSIFMAITSACVALFVMVFT
ncbi:hypothetical protein SADUNF_Sadunf02G0084600 [Salix dunnii]|uniref:Phytocyanin domain-containing protein n=1 Tax=Salix dunnii TaxID=1413687 RepID=A0A835N6P3_9ROSI|nr:hypothetical protein SADUNF_Sadunf02G0084600 [Salix dunnii]